MKTIFILNVITGQSGTSLANNPLSYLIGAVVALLILGYLIYTLLRPEKF